MNIWRMLLSGDVQDRLDELYEAGCGDMLFGVQSGEWFAEVVCDVDDLESAITDVQSVGDVTVTHVFEVFE